MTSRRRHDDTTVEVVVVVIISFRLKKNSKIDPCRKINEDVYRKKKFEHVLIKINHKNKNKKNKI